MKFGSQRNNTDINNNNNTIKHYLVSSSLTTYIQLSMVVNLARVRLISVRIDLMHT